MKKYIQHFFHTVLMACAVWGVSMLPPDTDKSLWVMGAWGLSTLIFAGALIYALMRWRRGATLAIAMLLMMGTGVALAQNEQVPQTPASSSMFQKPLSEMVEFKDIFCNANETFRPSTAVRNNVPPDPLTITQARQFMESYERELNAGIFTKGRLWGLNSNRYSSAQLSKIIDARDCAEDFLEKVAKYNVLQQEWSVSTVSRLLKLDQNSCWPCGIATLMLDTVEGICGALEAPIKKAALGLLGIMFLFWILIKVLMMISMFGYGGHGDFFTEFLTRGFLVLFAAALLQFPMSDFYAVTVSPMISVTSSLSQAMVNISITGNTGTQSAGGGMQSAVGIRPASNSLSARVANPSQLMCSCCAAGNKYNCNGRQSGDRLRDGAILTADAKKELMCMTCSVYKQTAPMVAAGRVMIYWALHTSGFWSDVLSAITFGWWDDMRKFVPMPVGMWIMGLIFIASFTVLSALIAFKLLDIFIRFGFVFLLTPFLIVTYVFPISRKYTKRGWDFFVHALLSIMALSLGMALLLSCFMASFPDNVVNVLREYMAYAGEPSNGYANKMYEALTSTGGTFYVVFLLLILVFFGISLLKASQVVIESLADLSCNIPSLCASGVAGLIKTATAFMKVGMAAAHDAADRIENRSEVNDGKRDDEKKDSKGSSKGPPTPGKALGKFANDATKDVGNAAPGGGDAAGKAAGKAVEQGGKVAGEGLKTGGKAVGKGGRAAGNSMMKLGAGVSSTVVGAIVGVPLMIAGAAVSAGATAAEISMRATGAAVKGASKVAGKATEKGTKAAVKGGRAAVKTAKKGTQAAGKAAGKGKNAVKSAGKKAGQNGDPKKTGKPEDAKKKEQNKTKKDRQAKNKYKNKPSALERGLNSVDNMISGLDDMADTLEDI